MRWETLGFNPQKGIQFEFRGPLGFFEKLEEILEPHLPIPPIQLRVKNNKVLWAYSAWLLGINLILQFLGGNGGVRGFCSSRKTYSTE